MGKKNNAKSKRFSTYINFEELKHNEKVSFYVNNFRSMSDLGFLVSGCGIMHHTDENETEEANKLRNNLLASFENKYIDMLEFFLNNFSRGVYKVSIDKEYCESTNGYKYIVHVWYEKCFICRFIKNYIRKKEREPDYVCSFYIEVDLD